MSGNEHDDSSGLSETASLGALSSGRGVNLATSDQEEYWNDRWADIDLTLPTLGVKITGYRLLNMWTVLSFGSAKAILTYMGRSTAPTTLDWVAGTLLAVLLYWIGLFEQGNVKKWDWFFQVDLAPGIGHCAKRAIGGVLGTLFYIDYLFVAPPLIGLLGCLLVDLQSGYVSSFGRFSIAICVLFFWFCVGIFTQFGRIQTRAWGSHWRRLIRFVDDYGPMAPLMEEYGWFGEGVTVGFFCVVALVWSSPFFVYVHAFHT